VKSFTGAPYSIKSYSLSHSWTLWWRVRWLKQCRLEVSAKLQQRWRNVGAAACLLLISRFQANENDDCATSYGMTACIRPRVYCWLLTTVHCRMTPSQLIAAWVCIMYVSRSTAQSSVWNYEGRPAACLTVNTLLITAFTAGAFIAISADGAAATVYTAYRLASGIVVAFWRCQRQRKQLHNTHVKYK